MAPTTSSRSQTKQGRFYEVEGIGLVPSVTTILQVINKPALMGWAAKVERELVLEVSSRLYQDVAETPRMNPNAWITTMQARMGKEKAHKKELEKAGEIGSQVHALIEWTLRGELGQKPGPQPRIVDKAQWAFMAWEDWRKASKLKPLMVEQVVYSEKHRYAGTLDLLAEVNGVLTVVDWKTGKAVYSEAHLQNAAYRQAVREMGHGDPKQGLIVRLPKTFDDPEFEVVEAKSEGSQFTKFTNAIALWTWMQEMETEYQERQAMKEQELAPALEKSIEAARV